MRVGACAERPDSYLMAADGLERSAHTEVARRVRSLRRLTSQLLARRFADPVDLALFIDLPAIPDPAALLVEEV